MALIVIPLPLTRCGRWRPSARTGSSGPCAPTPLFPWGRSGCPCTSSSASRSASTSSRTQVGRERGREEGEREEGGTKNRCREWMSSAFPACQGGRDQVVALARTHAPLYPQLVPLSCLAQVPSCCWCRRSVSTTRAGTSWTSCPPSRTCGASTWTSTRA